MIQTFLAVNSYVVNESLPQDESDKDDNIDQARLTNS